MAESEYMKRTKKQFNPKLVYGRFDDVDVAVQEAAVWAYKTGCVFGIEYETSGRFKVFRRQEGDRWSVKVCSPYNMLPELRLWYSLSAGGVLNRHGRPGGPNPYLRADDVLLWANVVCEPLLATVWRFGGVGKEKYEQSVDVVKAAKCQSKSYSDVAECAYLEQM